MSKKIWITGLIILAIIAAVYIFINKPEVFREVSDMIIEKPHTMPVISETKTAAYVIADPTGSTYLDYAIPQVDTNFISQLADKIYQRGGGYIWLSNIDRNSKNNKVLYASITAPLIKNKKPERFSGETYNEYDKRVKKYMSDTRYFNQDSLKNYHGYLSKKREYLILCNDLLNSIYIKGSPDNQWSDVIGSLNGAFYSLSTISDSAINKYVVAFSDLQQDTPNLNYKPTLNSIPADIKLLAVNPVPGSSKMITNNALVLDNPDRVFDYINK